MTIKRRIVIIDADRCNGCGACATACHEGAIVMQDGKAVLLRDDYCDGLGDCLPACEAGAISFEEREALPYDEAAVVANLAAKQKAPLPCHSGCPGSMAQTLPGPLKMAGLPETTASGPKQASCLGQWPVQLRLVPANAPFLANASLLLAADCTAFAFADFHTKFMQGKITLIGCPKLDAVDYTEKLHTILQYNNIHDLTVVKMGVPCCMELARAARQAILTIGRELPMQVITITPGGEIAAEPLPMAT